MRVPVEECVGLFVFAFKGLPQYYGATALLDALDVVLCCLPGVIQSWAVFVSS